MLSAFRRRVTVAATASLIGLVAAGCGEVREQTQWDDDRTLGSSATAGDILIRDAIVVSDEGAGDGTMYMSLFNRGRDADELVGVRVGGIDASPAGGPLAIPAGGSTTIAPDGTRLDVTGVDVVPGLLVDVEFIFEVAPRATARVIVQRPDGLFAEALD